MNFIDNLLVLSEQVMTDKDFEMQREIDKQSKSTHFARKKDDANVDYYENDNTAQKHHNNKKHFDMNDIEMM